MDSIKYVIDYVYNLATTTYLTFGNFSFSCFTIWIAMAGLSITCKTEPTSSKAESKKAVI